MKIHKSTQSVSCLLPTSSHRQTCAHVRIQAQHRALHTLCTVLCCTQKRQYLSLSRHAFNSFRLNTKHFVPLDDYVPLLVLVWFIHLHLHIHSSVVCSFAQAPTEIHRRSMHVLYVNRKAKSMNAKTEAKQAKRVSKMNWLVMLSTWFSLRGVSRPIQENT